MYRDIIHYELAEGVEETRLMQIAQSVYNNWMLHQPGFVSWEIHKNNTGSYTDIVTWLSENDAKKAELAMAQLPQAADWFACYKENSIESEKLNRLKAFANVSL